MIAGTPAAPGGGGAAAAAAREKRGDIQVLWKKYRGPGEVKIAEETINLENGGDAKKFVEAKTTATFSAPGTYWLRAQVNDSSGNGGGGDQCCWTTAHIVVNVEVTIFRRYFSRAATVPRSLARRRPRATMFITPTTTKPAG